MTLFSDLWNGIKQVGSGIANIFGAIIETLVSGVFWLIDRVFDAVEAVLDLFDWLFEKVGEFFSSITSKKTIEVLPPTPEVIQVYENLVNNGKVEEAPNPVKLRNRKAAMQVITENGKVVKTIIAGSDKGFSSDIDKALLQGKTYRIPIANN